MEQDRRKMLDHALSLCADDHESIETMGHWVKEYRFPGTQADIIELLTELITKGYVQAYRQVEDRFEPCEFRKEDSDTLWFYATSKGKDYLKQLKM